MIVDWFENCQKIYKTGTLTTEDPSDRKIVHRQEIVYLVFLRTVLHKSEEECYNMWRAIRNGTASIYARDEEQLRNRFCLAYNKSQQKKYADIKLDAPLVPVVIYKEEVDFLDDLDAPRWVKQYWAALLLYYKFAGQTTGRVQKSSALNAWCIRHVDYKKKNYGGKCQDIIAKYKMQAGRQIILDFPARMTESYPCYRPAFIKYRGTPVLVCRNVGEVDRLMNMIPDSTRACLRCGTRFSVTARTQRSLCSACYKLQRLRDKALSESRRREKMAKEVETWTPEGQNVIMIKERNNG